MGNAKYIGRVGALAVALGIGTAMVAAPWVAVAEPSAESSSTPDSSSSTAPPSDTGSAAAPESTDDSKPATSVDTSADADKPIASEEDDAPATAGIAMDPETAASADGDADASALPEPSEPIAMELEHVELVTDPKSSMPESPSVREMSPAVNTRLVVTGFPDNDDPAAAQTVTIDPPDTADPDAGETGGVESTDGPAITVAMESAGSTAMAEPTAAAVQLVAAPEPASPVSVMTGLVSGVLAWVGLGPSLANAPAAPAEAPLLWGLLAWVRREVERTLFNQTPATANDPAENNQSVDGVVTGDLNAVDAEDDPLSFTVTDAPDSGAVVINADGTFAYTPSAQLAIAGGTDEFTVNVEDQGPHVHGLPGMLNFVTFGLLGDSGHSSVATVAVTVQPINQAPQAGSPAFTIESVDPDTGVVSGTVNVTDPDGDALSYSLGMPPDPAKGTVAVDPTTGEWTFTPTLDARLRAISINAIPADQQVSFTISASDGQAATVVAVTGPVQPVSSTTITVGDFPIEVAVSPDGAAVYVANFNANSVSVIDTSTNVITTIAVGQAPSGMAVSPDGATVYVANIGGDSVSVIDTTTNAVTTIAVGDGPTSVAVSPDGGTVYIANAGADSVSVIDTSTNAVTTIAVGDQPFGVAITPDGATVYVANAESDTVSVIDTATNAVTTIAVGNRPFHVAISPDGATAYVSNGIAGTVSVIDTATNTVTTTITGTTGGLAVSPDGAHAYVTNQFGDSASVIDTDTNTVIAVVPVGDDPRAVAVSPDGTRLYVTNAAGDSVTVYTLG